MVARKVKAWEEPTAFSRFIKFITFGTLGEQDSDAIAITGGAMTGVKRLGSVEAGVSAAGSAQGDATLLNGSDITEVSTTAASTGVRLPPVTVGDTMFVYNGGASTLTVYPATGEFIDAASVNVGLAAATDVGVTFYGATTSLWVTTK